MGTFEDIASHVVTKLQLKATRDDTFFHQLNRVYYMVMFIAFAIFSGSNQYIGDPISCWCPKEFKGSMVNYANTYCWVQNTYQVLSELSIPQGHDEREEKEIHYYQWVPLIFTLQAILFMSPRVFWKMWSGYTGLNIQTVLTMSERATLGDPEDVENEIYSISEHLKRWIIIRDSSTRVSQFKSITKARSCAAKVGLRYGNYMALAYAFTTLLYLMNGIGQFLLLENLTAFSFRYIGHDFVNSLLDSKPWQDKKRFPTVVLCDFDIRQKANLQRWTVQCTLPLNMFNEKIFLFIWFALIILSFVNFLYLIYTIFVFFIPYTKVNYIGKYLVIKFPEKRYLDDPILRRKVEYFVDEFLRCDGVFILWIITQNSSQTVTSEVILKLWTDYMEFHENQEKIKKNRNKGAVPLVDTA